VKNRPLAVGGCDGDRAKTKQHRNTAIPDMTYENKLAREGVFA